MRRSCNEKGGGQNAKWERSKSNRDGRTGLWSAGHHGGAGDLRFDGIEAVAIAARNRGGAAPPAIVSRRGGHPSAFVCAAFRVCLPGRRRLFFWGPGHSCFMF